MSNGGLTVFKNPAGKEGQYLERLFEHSYQCKVVNDDDKITLLVAAKGILYALEIASTEEES